jgi:hypothetical protein
MQTEVRAWRHDSAWSDLRVAQRKPWADEVMEAIGRRAGQSANPPAAQPEGSGRGQQGSSRPEGTGVGVRGGAIPGPEGQGASGSRDGPKR